MDIPQVLKVSQLTATEVQNVHSLWRSFIQIQGRQHRFYINQIIFVHYASFFTNLILSMKSVLLQRTQGESSSIFFDIVNFHTFRRHWIIKDKQINKIGWILR